MKRIQWQTFLFPIILIFITLLICFRNYTPNTFLTGWDTLHPELNFSLNFKRLLTFWHSEQGLGAIPAHAQMSDIPRVFILYLLHFILPLNFLRYSYIFLCFILGPLGIYYLINYIFHQNQYSKTIAFLASLFYIFNLSTVQQFYVPFEMFPTQWAFLPWIILFSLKYLKTNSRKNLIIFSLFTLFTTPQAYAPQLWYAFFFIYTAFLLIHSFFQKTLKKRTAILIALTLLINSFWLTPSLVYIFNSRSTPTENRDNRLYSQEYLLRNRQNGTIADVPLIKGFYLDWSAFNSDSNSFSNLMPQWQDHLKNPLVLIIGYLLFLASLSGLIICFIKKDYHFIAFSPFFIIPLILLANKIFPFSFLFDFLIKNPIIKEAFRFIFTKLSTLLLFGYTLFFAYFFHIIFPHLKEKFKKILPILISLSLFFYAFPMFSGYLISPIVRVNIPQEYFDLWQFMSQQENGRILTLPLNQSSGWQYYNWGYQGSGFLWFNLKQNLLDRDSDRWSHQNEQSYREFFNSLYNQNPDIFSQNLNKYQIQYLIWDKSIINPNNSNNDQITFKYEITDLLNNLEGKNEIKPIYQIKDLIVYKINRDFSKNNIKTINNYISPSYIWGHSDNTSPDYITTDSFSQNFLFRNYLDKVQKLDTNIINPQQISPNKWQINFSNNLPNQIPILNQVEDIIPASVYFIPSSETNTIYFDIPLPLDLLQNISTKFDISKNFNQVRINDQNFSLENLTSEKYLGSVNLFINDQNYLNNQPINLNFQNVTNTSSNNIQINTTAQNYNLSKNFESLNKTDGYSINLENLPQNYGYIIGFKSQYTSGIPLRFCLKNLYSLTCSIEDQLNQNQELKWDFFVIPPSGKDIGYKLDLSNISYGGLTSQTYLDQIAIVPIPFNLLHQTKYVSPTPPPSKNYFILNQSFSSDWLAFYFKGITPVFLKNHVLANNWANAWELPTGINLTTNDIHIFFWPQIFQYLGLMITTTTLILIFKKK